jgi:hypothetical protein
MHRKKEEVILRILTQESLDLELGMKKYEFLKFWSYFSEARDLFVNIFQILGLNCKILGLRVDFGKVEGPKCKMSEIPGITNYFSTDKVVD